MKEAPDDQTDDRRTAIDDFQTEDLPPDAEWELITQVPCDPSESDGLTTAIVYAVADAEGISASDVKQPPLYEVIDTTALEAALFGSETGHRASQCTTEFMYHGYRVTIQSDGWVLVHDRAGE